MKKYTSLLCFLACIFCVKAQVADKITVIGSAVTTNPAPSSFSQEVRFHVKWNSTIGVPHIGSPGPGTYSALMTIAPWSDGSGSKHHQLNFNEDGLFWRKGAFGSSWESWKRIITADQNGNVGIGTASPDYNLQLHSSDNPALAIGKININTNGKSTLWFFAGDATAKNGFAIQYNKSTGTDRLGFFDGGGVEILSLKNGGSVGIGTAIPQKKLHVSGTGDVEQWIEATDNGFASLTLKSNNKQWHWSKRPGTDQDALRLFYHDGAAWTLPYMSVLPNGNIGIGSSLPTSKLSVKGTIHAEEVKVDLTVPGPDYVFEKDYDLLSLTELETYITQHKHLPEVPSAKEMEANGLNLKEMNLILLKKVEELTLHLIEMKKENEKQENLIQELIEKNK